MRFAQIRKMDISNGPGIGVSLFVQGCSKRCKGCHNSSIWDFNGGEKFTQETIETIIDLMRPDYIKRLSILGGEPLEKDNYKDLFNLILAVKEVYPDKDIWFYTGYYLNEIADAIEVWEALESKKNIFYLRSILKWVDYIVDGPFIQELKDITLAFRGSSNQNIYTNVYGHLIDRTDLFDKGEF